MADILSVRERSERMSLIQSRGNIDTELALAKMLRRYRITGWRRHLPVFGKPDFVFQQVRLAVFVDGCFWHGCPRCGHIPKTRRTYWRTKILRNKRRDRLVTRTLHRAGWRVIRIWECDLAKHPETCIRRILEKLRADG